MQFKKLLVSLSELKITDYGLASISGGATALCEVLVNGNSIGYKDLAKSIGEDEHGLPTKKSNTVLSLKKCLKKNR